MTDTARAMIVDDDETLRLVTARQLKRLGFTVDSAADGEEAVQLFKNQHYDLILMDIQMPSKDGYEATADIRKVEAERLPHRKCSIVAMTASQERERALRAGMDDFLYKPFVFDSLKFVIDKWRANGTDAATTTTVN